MNRFFKVTVLFLSLVSAVTVATQEDAQAASKDRAEMRRVSRRVGRRQDRRKDRREERKDGDTAPAPAVDPGSTNPTTPPAGN